METTSLSKPYLKPGGFSEPVVAMRKIFTSTQCKSNNNNSNTIRSKSSLISKNFDKSSNNFSFDKQNFKEEKDNKPKLKASSNRATFIEENFDDLEKFMIYAIKPDYTKKITNSQINFCTERNERPKKRISANFSVDNRNKKKSNSSIKNMTNKSNVQMENAQNENIFYKENIGLRGLFK